MKLPLLLTSLADSAAHYPKAIALLTDTTAWNYGQFWSRISQYETALATLHLPTNVAIAVTADKTVETLALMLALGKRGHTPLAVSPGLGDTVKPTMFSSAGVFCELSAESNSDGPSIAVKVPAAIQEAIPSAYADATCPLMLTTSGSTGIPKVVELSAEGVNAFFGWGAEYFQVRRDSRVLSYAPLNFDLSLLEIWTPLMQGATVILADTARATQSDYLRRLVHQQRPDLIQAVPMFYNLLCPAGEHYVQVMDRVRHVVFTGDTTPQALRERVAAAFPQATFHNIYGCTETNDSFVYSADAQAIVRHERLPLGGPITGVAYRIVTEDGSELAGPGEGELHTSTPFLAHGYTDPSLTAKAFYPEQDGYHTYYRTGDRVARDEHGQLNLLGRKDFIVKVRGVRTNLQDIEQALAKMPIVKNAVVIPVNDEIAGVILHAVVEPSSGHSLDGMAMRIYCAQHLPQTSVPRRFHFHENPLPTTSTGKPDRKSLAQFIQPQGSESV
ncbi:AMP-binding protein [Modicisalibacter coralii]|uniref:AMP-binding protein n=1 Tax=Modicisalibacter coralii TaxID=2304602 RepID=UPI00100AC13F|nr:AMP-binding protein [Halomonas coralii]